MENRNASYSGTTRFNNGTLMADDKIPATVTAQERKDMPDKALSIIILCLSDKPLREVVREMTATSIWKKCDALYMTKSLANRLYMKRKLYSYRMHEDRSILEQLVDFNKTLDDLDKL